MTTHLCCQLGCFQQPESYSSRRVFAHWRTGQTTTPAPCPLPIDRSRPWSPNIGLAVGRLNPWTQPTPFIAKPKGMGEPPGVPERGKPQVSTGGSRPRPEGPGRGAARPRGQGGQFAPLRGAGVGERVARGLQALGDAGLGAPKARAERSGGAGGGERSGPPRGGEHSLRCPFGAGLHFAVNSLKRRVKKRACVVKAPDR